MIVFSVITCLYTYKSPGKKQDFVLPIQPEDDDPRLECDLWNFAAQIDWEGDDDGYPIAVSSFLPQCTCRRSSAPSRAASSPTASTAPPSTSAPTGCTTCRSARAACTTTGRGSAATSPRRQSAKIVGALGLAALEKKVIRVFIISRILYHIGPARIQ
ncbi:hypothetical protein CDAR_603941 [Caerostris darwini]|uniref:Uncharacterized protein n=1 Tax=Caerostris darwini TaxID=1538125 RepID=A0AAV4R438_9ARAC|nr:hypothetical protein CDAR_603941 [Caerostris darwini]